MGQIAEMEAKPPYVRFERRSVEDRQKSIEAGHYIGRDVDYALITPAGSKDCVERIVGEWFEKLARDVREQRMPQQWADHFKAVHKAWLDGQDEPVDGTSLKNWPVISPSQLKLCWSLHVTTVEMLATANEETLTRMGMGGRELKRRAIDWIGQAKETGKMNAELHAMRVKGEELLARNQMLETTALRFAQVIKQYESRMGIHAKDSALAGFSVEQQVPEDLDLSPT